MRIRSCAITLSGLCAFAAAAAHAGPVIIAITPAAPAAGFHRAEISRAAIGSNPIRLWRVYDVDLDCSENKGIVLRVLQPPAHGSVSLKDEPDYPQFPAVNPRSKCNERKILQHGAYYQATAGFTGEDRAVLQVQTPEGRVNEITFDVDVR